MTRAIFCLALGALLAIGVAIAERPAAHYAASFQPQEPSLSRMAGIGQ